MNMMEAAAELSADDIRKMRRRDQNRLHARNTRQRRRNHTDALEERIMELKIEGLRMRQRIDEVYLAQALLGISKRDSQHVLPSSDICGDAYAKYSADREEAESAGFLIPVDLQKEEKETRRKERNRIHAKNTRMRRRNFLSRGEEVVTAMEEESRLLRAYLISLGYMSQFDEEAALDRSQQSKSELSKIAISLSTKARSGGRRRRIGVIESPKASRTVCSAVAAATAAVTAAAVPHSNSSTFVENGAECDEDDDDDSFEDNSESSEGDDHMEEIERFGGGKSSAPFGVAMKADLTEEYLTAKQSIGLPWAVTTAEESQLQPLHSGIKRTAAEIEKCEKIEIPGAMGVDAPRDTGRVHVIGSGTDDVPLTETTSANLISSATTTILSETTAAAASAAANAVDGVVARKRERKRRRTKQEMMYSRLGANIDAKLSNINAMAAAVAESTGHVGNNDGAFASALHGQYPSGLAGLLSSSLLEAVRAAGDDYSDEYDDSEGGQHEQNISSSNRDATAGGAAVSPVSSPNQHHVNIVPHTSNSGNSHYTSTSLAESAIGTNIDSYNYSSGQQKTRRRRRTKAEMQLARELEARIAAGGSAEEVDATFLLATTASKAGRAITVEDAASPLFRSQKKRFRRTKAQMEEFRRHAAQVALIHRKNYSGGRQNAAVRHSTSTTPDGDTVLSSHLYIPSSSGNLPVEMGASGQASAGLEPTFSSFSSSTAPLDVRTTVMYKHATASRNAAEQRAIAAAAAINGGSMTGDQTILSRSTTTTTTTIITAVAGEGATGNAYLSVPNNETYSFNSFLNFPGSFGSTSPSPPQQLHFAQSAVSQSSSASHPPYRQPVTVGSCGINNNNNNNSSSSSSDTKPDMSRGVVALALRAAATGNSFNPVTIKIAQALQDASAIMPPSFKDMARSNNVGNFTTTAGSMPPVMSGIPVMDAVPPVVGFNSARTTSSLVGSGGDSFPVSSNSSSSSSSSSGSGSANWGTGTVFSSGHIGVGSSSASPRNQDPSYLLKQLSSSLQSDEAFEKGMLELQALFPQQQGVTKPLLPPALLLQYREQR